jgi:hypothetical protein
MVDLDGRAFGSVSLVFAVCSDFDPVMLVIKLGESDPLVFQIVHSLVSLLGI